MAHRLLHAQLPQPDSAAATLIQKIVDAVAPLTFDRIYSGFADEVIDTGGAEAVRFSAQRYIDWVTDKIRDPNEQVG